MRRNGTKGLLVLAMVGALGACGGEEESAPAATVDAAAPATEEPAGSASAVTDPQIAHVAVTANTIDVEMAELAADRTENEEVLGFARTMITDHTAVNEQASALAGRLGVTPEENPISRSLEADAEAVADGLEGLSGAEFDRAYMAREVAYHQAVLDALDQTLIPSASNAELRGLLETVRPAIEAHLERARSIQGSLGGSAQ